MSIRTLDDLPEVEGKVLLVRVDLNVPMQDTIVTDHTRLDRLVPTLNELTDKGAKIVLLSHFGRPRGKDLSLSLEPIAAALGGILDRDVLFVPDCVGHVPETAISKMKNGDIILLENLRFYPEEEKNDTPFAKEMAQLGDIYINDAFSCAHRAHASTDALAKELPAYAGRLMAAELSALSRVLDKPESPVMGIVGGAKVSTKLDLLNNLVQKLDILVLGGGMANTFLAALENPIGKSLCEHDMKAQAVKVLSSAQENNCKVMLPKDVVVAKEFKANAETRLTTADYVLDDDMVLDIGQDSVKEICDEIDKGVKTILWNGPMGAFETKPFDTATVDLAQYVAQKVTDGNVACIAGGGDTVAALAHADVVEKMTYVSTAGGAFLEYLEGHVLPGVKALSDSAKKVA